MKTREVVLTFIAGSLLGFYQWSQEARTMAVFSQAAGDYGNDGPRLATTTGAATQQPQQATSAPLSPNLSTTEAAQPAAIQPQQATSKNDLHLLPNPSGACPTMARNWTSSIRAERFPSKEERICQYLSVWFDNKWQSDEYFSIRETFKYQNDSDAWADIVIYDRAETTMEQLSSRITPDGPFHVWLDEEDVIFHDLATRPKQRTPVIDARLGNRFVLNAYAGDMQKLFQILKRASPITPLLAQFGDQVVHLTAPLPIFTKFRQIDFSPAVPQPIVLKLESRRHFHPINKVVSNDVPWEEKLPMAIFRGALTGFNDEDQYLAEEYNANTSIATSMACQKIPRCQLVYAARSKNITTVDVGLTLDPGRFETIDGMDMTAPSTKRPELTKYKIIISVEGNDVASGLKWNLYTHSVVMMPPPTKMSYALENLLVPWIHYIPLKSNFSDLEKQVNWVLENDDKAREIAELGRQFIDDLLRHPDAAKENEEIELEIVHRYIQLWKTAVATYQERGAQVSWRKNTV